MKKIIFLLIMITCTTSLAQSKIEGFIYDGVSNDPLPYCTIRVYGAETHYTITNEDGKFAVDNVFSTDSLEVRYLGFKTKKTVVSYFEKEPKLYLEMDVSVLDEVVLTAGEDKEYPYKLLGRVIDIYRKSKNSTVSKAFLTMNSSTRNVPIEQVEGFYNSEQNLEKGILDLRVKSGRFGQNRSFPYYSLDNSKILSDFQFFGTSNQILPDYPGNLTYNAIERKYDVKIDDCINCRGDETLISFSPKEANGRLFYGKMLVDTELLVVKKIELWANDPITNTLTSINEDVILTPKEIKLNIVFNPMDLEMVQYLDLSFQMGYRSKNVSEIIDSRTFLYFFDYDTFFEEPYFTKKIAFNNDYDKMIALQASDDFWEINYQFPKSINENKSMDFMKKNGFLINFNNYIPLDDLKYTRPTVLSWQQGRRLKWEYLHDRPTEGDGNVVMGNNRGKGLPSGKAFDSPFEQLKDQNSQKGKDNINISYMVDSYKGENGITKIVSRTLLDINSSQFSYERTKNKLVYFNIIFDIYEVYRQLAASRIREDMTFDKVKSIYDEMYKAASSEVKKIEKETRNGSDYEDLVKWNDRIKAKLKIDNFALVQ
ncbi:carboxypeptidase-like regulatory domain-containing protein [Arenibacter sp. S6351L]|uniref:carboxypeptidase-like regulatory domain-containing protein n=1 Tax=Arenibacter sp. S6351L TaxID=2926407 RepID=UPI001FF37914|nr:carboxypeptidase-like regulatory domain-containing protein [Arenibacter sp. S6351L]MCK0136394.1 carboxypeptidase-like regulatory domain-containing protein [Arenibacter sp. S6351L]